MIHRRVLWFCVILQLGITGHALADQPAESAWQLADAMAFAQSLTDSERVCRDNAAAEDVEAKVADHPMMLGGFKATDPEWPEARRAYVEMLQAGCEYARLPMMETVASTLTDALSEADRRALLEFYGSELGRRFLGASLAANKAAMLVMEPLVDSDAAYAEYERKLAALVDRRTNGDKTPPPQVVKLEAVDPVGVESADEAVRVSGRVMQEIVAGRTQQGLMLLAPHMQVAGAEFEKAIEGAVQAGTAYEKSFGKSLDYELLSNDSVGGSVIRSVFLQRLERHGALWMFVWYKGDSGWIVSRFKFSDDLSALFGA
ncbi:DUF2059 domain-containing protein [Pseudoxanthomonas sp. Soil82]|uniref:DUF2059 domain-containing protein n=1 Tax=Pseudoxanthomonas sp. Soil82 TaxID=3157341 RepID=UPI00338EFD5A